MKTRKAKTASKRTGHTNGSQNMPTIQSRIRMATEAIETQRKSCTGSIEQSMQEVIFNLGLLANAEDFDFHGAVAGGIGKWLEHMGPKFKSPIIAEWSDLSTPSLGPSRLKEVFISYAAEDKDLAFELGAFWKANSKSPLYLGRSGFEDNVTSKSIDESWTDRNCALFSLRRILFGRNRPWSVF